MNESGKTSVLEALAKVNYFENDEIFKFNLTHDYPRKQKKSVDKSGENPEAVTLYFTIDDVLAKRITDDVGVGFKSKEFSVTKNYADDLTWNVRWVASNDFVSAQVKKLGIKDKTIIDGLVNIPNDEFPDFDSFIKSLDSSIPTEEIECTKTLKGYFCNTWEGHPIDGYIVTTYLKSNLPKFMYYDDYYMLPSRVKLNNIETSANTEPGVKTAKALLELADVDIKKVVQSDNFEDFVAELEATQTNISDELFKYWTTNKNLEILFQIDKREETVNQNNRRIVEHILDIRVKNRRSGVSLPLGNRSKGFNWFFSFLVWFKKIQESKDSTYILLLDEPGLNLHAKAQNDLLRFLTDLSDKYQIIYTTHSPFMIESSKLNQVRTVVEQEDGTHISDSVQEKDPNTLFPLQAALGYDLAQNLFVSPKNLVVEGISDLVFLNLLSGILQEKGKPGLKNDITIIPVGGADKVATFVSLLRGNELDMVCLLDTFTDQSAKQRLENLVSQHIIKDKKIVFYHDILGRNHADIEDLFDISDYLSFYNGAFGKTIKVDDVDTTKPLLEQLRKLSGGKDFNHYSPANFFAKNASNISLLNRTLDNFDKLFTKLNGLF
jgi:predicted ATPase